MSQKDWKKDLALAMRAEAKGLQTHSPDGLPWALTPEQAAAELGVSLATVKQFMKLGWLRPVRPGHPRIAAHLVRQLKTGRPY